MDASFGSSRCHLDPSRVVSGPRHCPHLRLGTHAPHPLIHCIEVPNPLGGGYRMGMPTTQAESPTGDAATEPVARDQEWE